MSTNKTSTIRERVLQLASKQNFNSSVAKRHFKGRGMTSDRIQNSIMATARGLALEGKLTRVSRGNYRKSR